MFCRGDAKYVVAPEGSSKCLTQLKTPSRLSVSAFVAANNDSHARFEFGSVDTSGAASATLRLQYTVRQAALDPCNLISPWTSWVDMDSQGSAKKRTRCDDSEHDSPGLYVTTQHAKDVEVRSGTKSKSVLVAFDSSVYEHKKHVSIRLLSMDKENYADSEWGMLPSWNSSQDCREDEYLSTHDKDGLRKLFPGPGSVSCVTVPPNGRIQSGGGRFWDDVVPKDGFWAPAKLKEKVQGCWFGVLQISQVSASRGMWSCGVQRGSRLQVWGAALCSMCKGLRLL